MKLKSYNISHLKSFYFNIDYHVGVSIIPEFGLFSRKFYNLGYR